MSILIIFTSRVRDVCYRLFLILFLTSSLGVIVLYWSWYTYYSYDNDTSLLYDDKNGVCFVLTLIFLLLLGPVCLNYRNIELNTQEGRTSAGTKRTRAQGRQRERGRARSPPPKYQEALAPQTSRS